MELTFWRLKPLGSPKRDTSEPLLDPLLEGSSTEVQKPTSMARAG